LTSDPNHLIIGGDGGVHLVIGLPWTSKNIPWRSSRNHVDNRVPFTCGGLRQRPWCIPSAVRSNGIAIATLGIGGDGFYVSSTGDENYARSRNGNASRVNLMTLERTIAGPQPGGAALRRLAQGRARPRRCD
jgi:hypothetical protein